MIGTSYNGTIPEAVATTGVEGLEAIVPISAISDWYDYYRANGMVRAPHSSSNPSGNNNAFQGEDLDVLADVVYSRIDETGPRTICQPEIDYLKAHIDRATGNRSGFWQERNYMKDVENVHAATLLAHGNNDFNVMTKNAAQFYDALKKQDVPHMFYFHQGGHGGAPPDVLINYWFTRYLYGVQNGVENAAALVGRARGRVLPAAPDDGDRRSVEHRDADRGGHQPVPDRLHADGAADERRRHDHEHDAPDHGHPGLHAPRAGVARWPPRTGQKVADGAVVSLVCGNAEPDAVRRVARPGLAARSHCTSHPGAPARGGLTLAPRSPAARRRR